MKNQNVIDTIKNRYAQFRQELPAEQTFKFSKEDISMDDTGILIDGMGIDEKSQKKFLARMKVKPEFMEIAYKATRKDWEVIAQNLKNELPDSPFYAKVRVNDDGSEEVFGILDYPVYESSGLIDNDQTIEKICTELENTEDSYKLFNAQFDRKTNSIIIGLINEDTKFDVFGDGSNDVWMSGVEFKMTDTEFSNRHLLERLVCTNGMTTKEQGFTTHINKKNFNQEKIDASIENTFKDTYKEIFKQISTQANALKQHEISVREFYEYTKVFNKEAKKLELVDEVKQVFDDSVFFEKYAMDIKEQSLKWKATARTGINAYQFFNALTYTATHIFGDASPNVSSKLKLNSSNFFFKDKFDLDEIAPNIEFNYGSNHPAFN